MSDSLLGQTLGNYLIQKVIASGPTATVYEARNTSLDRSIAIKVLQASGPQKDELIERFRREGKFIARLRHSNIVHVYDLGAVDGTLYLAMELVAGKPLNEIIEQGPIDPAKALDITRQVADALAAAHAQNIIHRDIKPNNIMIDDSGGVKMMDFGIAKDLEMDSGLTQVGVSIGTRYYMSPEQVKGGKLDHRTDIYSLGVVLFEMLTGSLPYSPNLSFLDYMTKIVQGPFPSPRYVNPQLTETVEQIVMRTAAIDPDQRYATATDLSDDIRFCIRVGAYKPGNQEEAAAIAANPFKRLFSRQHAAVSNQQHERASIARRRLDRERNDEFEALKAASTQRFKEGRQFRRIALRRKCRVLVYNGCENLADLHKHSAPASARLLDLGNGGAAFFLREKLEKKSLHVFEFQFDDAKAVRSLGKVCWRRRFDPLNAYATGIHFQQISSADKERLAAVMIELSERAGF